MVPTTSFPFTDSLTAVPTTAGRGTTWEDRPGRWHDTTSHRSADLGEWVGRVWSSCLTRDQTRLSGSTIPNGQTNLTTFGYLARTSAPARTRTGNVGGLRAFGGGVFSRAFRTTSIALSS